MRSTTVSASAATSRRPRLSPCPASGWTTWAASATSASRSATKRRAKRNENGIASTREARLKAPSFKVKRYSSSRRKSSGASAAIALASAWRSFQTMLEKRPRIGRMANGPPGRKCCSARPSWSRSWAIVATMPVCPVSQPTVGTSASARSRERAPSAATTSRALSRRPSASSSSATSRPGANAGHGGGDRLEAERRGRAAEARRRRRR